MHSLAFSPDGRLVVTASNDGTARVWKSTTGKSVAVLRGHRGPVFSAAFSSPDGRLVVTAGSDGTARVWEAASGKSVAVLGGSGIVVRSAAFGPHGRLVVTAGDEARVWEAGTGRSVAVLRGLRRSVYSAAFSRGGRLVVTVGSDGTAQIYTCEVCSSTEKLLPLAKSRVGRSLTRPEEQRYLHEP